jgi:hypothetical protein
MVTGCNLPGPVGPVCGGFARRTGVWRDVSRRRGEAASFPQRDIWGASRLVHIGGSRVVRPTDHHPRIAALLPGSLPLGPSGAESPSNTPQERLLMGKSQVRITMIAIRLPCGV